MRLQGGLKFSVEFLVGKIQEAHGVSAAQAQRILERVLDSNIIIAEIEDQANG